jgi:hypothetical protein
MKIFISHASEDTKSVARPIAVALKELGYEVWYDEYSLKLGDSLSREINKGLSNCDYGVVILSEAFFRKEWPMRELSGLAAKETGSTGKVILPVWHGVDETTIAKYSPTLADKKGVTTSNGIKKVINEIEKAIKVAFDGKENQSSQLNSVFQIGEHITKEKNITGQQVFEIVYENLKSSLYAENFYVALYDKKTNFIRFPLLLIEGKKVDIPSRSFGSGRTEYIIQSKDPLLIRTKTESVKWYKKSGNIEYIGVPFASWLGVPIIFQDEVLGVIAIYHATDDFVYGYDDLKTLQIVAQQVATSLRMSQLRNNFIDNNSNP